VGNLDKTNEINQLDNLKVEFIYLCLKLMDSWFFSHRFPPECFSCCRASAALAGVALLDFWVNLLRPPAAAPQLL